MDDTTGYSLSCTSHDALEWFNKGLVSFVSLYENSMSFFLKALEVDPDFVIVHCILVSPISTQYLCTPGGWPADYIWSTQASLINTLINCHADGMV